MMDTPATLNVDSTSKDLSIDILEVASTNKKSATDPLSGDITHTTTNLQLDPTTKKVPKVMEVLAAQKVDNMAEKENLDPRLKVSNRFQMKNVGKSVSTFIDENTAKNTKKD